MSALEVVMTTAEAKQVTERIKLLVGQIVDTTEKVVGLIEQAKAGEAWRVLGYSSWTAYVTAEFAGALEGLAKAERVPIVAKLSETGMSQRAITEVTATSLGTVNSDLAQVSHGGTPEGVQVLNTSPETHTSGLDGKTYLRNGRPTARGMTALVNDVPPPKPKPRRSPLPDAYARALYDLERVTNRLQKLHADDSFLANRQKLGYGTVRPASGVFDLLAALQNDLEGYSRCRGCRERMVPTYENALESECDACRGEA